MNISVIVPAYNAESTISACIKAVLEQSFSNQEYEIIVVDDGSTDNTASVIQTFPVRYIHQHNQGPASARNRGVQEAQGELVLFTDADCQPLSNWIEEMIRPFEKKQVMAVKGKYQTEQRALTARFAQAEFEERFQMLQRQDSIDMVDTYSAAYRKNVFLSFGGFDPAFPVANNEDTELSYKMSRAGCIMVFNPDAVVLHLGHPDSLMKYARLKFWRGYWRMVVYKKYPDKILKDSYTPQTLKLQILFLFLFFCSSAAALLPAVRYYPSVFLLLLFVVSTLPFTGMVIRKDPAVGLLAPFFLSVRAASLGLGAAWGVMTGGSGVTQDDQPEG